MITDEQILEIPMGNSALGGIFHSPPETRGIVVFAHGSGSSRFSERNQFVANHLHREGFSTLLFDLLTDKEEALDDRTRRLRFDIDFLGARLVMATDWLRERYKLFGFPFGYFGASTGGGAAMVAAARRPSYIKAIVSRGGRPDLAGASLKFVQAPTLLIVGEKDPDVLRLNRSALQQISIPETRLVTVPGAHHLFEDEGALETVARLAGEWFKDHL